MQHVRTKTGSGPDLLILTVSGRAGSYLLCHSRHWATML